MSVITALTAQNSVGVRGVYKVTGDFVRLQMEAVFEDIGVDALKCGMMADREVVEAVADVLERYPEVPLVLDTVFVAKSGAQLLEDRAVETMVERLFPRAQLVTPNIPETQRLVGFQVKDREDMARAAGAIRKMGARAVLIKGGHLEGDILLDLLLLAEGGIKIFKGRRIATPHTHGTGCTLSAAVTASLARGLSLEQAVAAARNYVRAGIRNSHRTGAGHGTLLHIPGEDWLGES